MIRGFEVIASGETVKHLTEEFIQEVLSDGIRLLPERANEFIQVAQVDVEVTGTESDGKDIITIKRPPVEGHTPHLNAVIVQKAMDVRDAIMNGADTMETDYGEKSAGGILNMILEILE